MIEQISGLIPNLQVEMLDRVMGLGYPSEETFAALDKLADEIAAKHAEL